MKKIILTLAVASLFVSCQQDKTAFIDNEQLIEDYQARIDLEAVYKTKVEAFTKSQDSVKAAFQQEVLAFQAQQNTLSPQKLQELYQALGQRQQSLQQQEQQGQQIIASESQKEIDVLLKEIDSFVVDYGNTNGYTYIFGKNKAGSVLYGSESNDITKEVTDALNKKFGSNE